MRLHLRPDVYTPLWIFWFVGTTLAYVLAALASTGAQYSGLAFVAENFNAVVYSTAVITVFGTFGMWYVCRPNVEQRLPDNFEHGIFGVGVASLVFFLLSITVSFLLFEEDVGFFTKPGHWTPSPVAIISGIIFIFAISKYTDDGEGW